MADPIPVEDPADPRVGDYVGLKDADLRRRRDGPDGDAPGRFIAEGALVLDRLLHSPYPVRSVLVTPQRYGPLSGLLGGVDAPVYLASQAVMNAVAGFNIHRGVLASAYRRPLPRPAELIASARRVAVLEDVNDLENLGVIFRNAAALGVDAVLLSPECCDPLYRRAVRVSMGHVLGLPFAVMAPWPDALSSLVEQGFEVVALSPGAGGSDVRGLGLAGLPKVALLLGAEGPGLSDGALQRATTRARIAMSAGVDSLNVGSASAVAFHAAMPAGGL